MAPHTGQQPSARRAVVVTLVASVLLVAGGVLAVKRAADEHLPRYPPPTHTATSKAHEVADPASAPRIASG